jgi:hypothetical protein
MFVLVHCLVSGHGKQIKDMNGDESDGLDECSLLPSLRDAYGMTNGISLGICAMDYRGDDNPYENAHTHGLIVDDVSHHEQPRIHLPICTFYSLAHAYNLGATSSSPLSLVRYVRREPDQQYNMAYEYTDDVTAVLPFWDRSRCVVLR